MTESSSPIPGGCILIARKMLNSDLMNCSPLVVKLWIWLLLKANWKARDQLDRGQLVTTIAEMQTAMSHYSGWRKVVPTKEEIRSAYGALTKATRITTRRTTRGMVVTVLNYDTYQDLAAYAPHTEDHKGNAMEPTATPHDTEVRELINKKPISAKAQPTGFTLFRDWWMHVFSIMEGDSYIFETGKDGKCLSLMLKAADWQEIVYKACHYLIDNERFPKGRPTISGLKSSINRYPGNVNGKADYFRELGLLPLDGVSLENWQPWKGDIRPREAGNTPQKGKLEVAL